MAMVSSRLVEQMPSVPSSSCARPALACASQVLRSAHILREDQAGSLQLMMLEEVMTEQDRLARQGLLQQGEPRAASSSGATRAYHMYAASAYGPQGEGRQQQAASAGVADRRPAAAPEARQGRLV